GGEWARLGLTRTGLSPPRFGAGPGRCSSPWDSPPDPPCKQTGSSWVIMSHSRPGRCSSPWDSPPDPPCKQTGRRGHSRGGAGPGSNAVFELLPTASESATPLHSQPPTQTNLPKKLLQLLSNKSVSPLYFQNTVQRNLLRLSQNLVGIGDSSL
ncbi:hypothetical protein MJO29_000232, partial [Puccinia striiformis f. sp. tritici]